MRTVSLEESLNILKNNELTVKETDLIGLSNLSLEDVALVRDSWANFDTERRLDLIRRLVNMSEYNLEVDFNGMFKFCLEDDSPEVRIIAIDGLWECDDRILLSAFVHILENDVSREVRASAARALGKFAALCQNGKMLAKDEDRIKEPLISVIEDLSEDLEVIRKAVESVSIFTTDEVEEIIAEAYESESFDMKCTAVYSMGKNCNSKWLDTVLEELGNSNPAMRYEASMACAELCEQEALPYLLALFEDEDDQVRSAAIFATGTIGGDLAKRALLECLDSSDDLNVEAAQEALDNLVGFEGSMNLGSSNE